MQDVTNNCLEWTIIRYETWIHGETHNIS